MTRKKVDDRIRTLITNSVKQHHRSLFVIVGDNGKDQVPNLHYILSKAQVKARPSVLWCYKNELGFSTHKKKRMRQIKKMVQRGLYDPTKDDPFELFVASTEVRWAYYRDSHKVLGQTYGMCVLQDFEALTPNLLARTVETVEGGGIVVILLRTMNSLRQLFSMTMDVHSRFRTENYNVVQPRFNERFILSLATCKSCAIIDDELNILPLSKHIRKIEPVELDEEQGSTKRADPELIQLKRSLEDTQPAGALVGLARTRDQAKAILTFIEAVSEKTLRSTVALTAARGRGKSAALGIAIASAVAYGYSNIFVTSPSPDNLTTVFEFVFKALDALKYKEHMDYEVIQSTNPEFNKAVVRVNLFHDHRQTIQYIQPQDYEMLAQAELVVIDEAAAIPLPLVRKLMGPYLVFLSSTINGYEGTGRSLSLKLLDQLRKKTAESVVKSSDWRTNEYMFKKTNASNNPWADSNAGSTDATKKALPTGTGAAGAVGGARVLREIELEEPIRYAQGDQVEKWLYHVLCLDSTKLKYRLISGTPHPQDCELFAVDRDALFSHHKMSERMLQRIMALYVASHYKNSPNDLQLLSDAPAHRLFVLLGTKQSQQLKEGEIPDVLCVVQVALEGGISKKTVKSQLAQGARAAGDMVPWMISQQFQDPEFANLNGARVVRISTHPDVTRMGYGQRALDLLTKFYSGKLTSLAEEDEATQASFEARTRPAVTSTDSANLISEKIKPQGAELSLLVPIQELPPNRMHYLSVSFGVTEGLFSFWQKTGMKPCYLRQTPNELTGEHSCIMINALDCAGMSPAPEPKWEASLCADFQRRFLALLSSAFREMSCSLAYGIALAASSEDSNNQLLAQKVLDADSIELLLLPHDLKRLEAYARSLVDYHMIKDLLPLLSHLYFENRVPGNMTLSNLQRALLIGMGLQGKTVDQLSDELGMPSTQLLALFNKSIRKFSEMFRKTMEGKIRNEMDNSQGMQSARSTKKKLDANVPLSSSLSQEQEEHGEEAMKEFQKNQKASLDGLDLQEYAIDGDDKAWEEALSKASKNKTGILSVKSNKKRPKVSIPGMESDDEAAATPKHKRRKSKGGDGDSSHKELQKAKFSGRKSAGKHRRKRS